MAVALPHLPSFPVVLFALGVSSTWLAALWVWQMRSRNAAWADFGWTVAIGALALAAACGGDGLPARRALVALLGGTWSARLAIHLWRDRLRGHHAEEGRYKRLRNYFGSRARIGFFVFFQAQALLATGLALPFVIAAGAQAPLAWSDGAALVLFVFALAMEHVADAQLSRFKQQDDSKGRVCREGLWRYSRHPNYFFEWLTWCAFALIAWPAVGGIWAWLAPIVMLVFILKISGVPTSERQSLSSRGDAYRNYQETTSVFVPWPPKGDVS